MKKAITKIILSIVASVLLLVGATACGSSSTGKVYDYLVTFNYNIGDIKDANCPDQYVGVKADSLVGIQPGYNNSFKETQIKDRYIAGWYTAQLDEDGNPKTDDKGYVLLDKKWDFASDRVTENMTLYADLQVTPTLTVKVDGGTDLTFSGTPGDKKTRPSDKYAPQKDGYTFYDYYEDEACTVKFSWPYTFTSEDKTVYARFIEGENWKVVTTAQEFKNAIALNSSAKIYVDADLDFSETSWTYGLEFNGEINGNGHKVTGISCTYSASKNTQSDFGLFGVLKSNAYIHDWTIENAQATFTASFKSLEYKVALFAWKAEAGVKIENVTVSGTLAQGKMDDDIKKYSEIEMSQFIAIGENLATVTNCDYSGVVIDDGTTSDDATTGDGATTDDEAITSDDGTEN